MRSTDLYSLAFVLVLLLINQTSTTSIKKSLKNTIFNKLNTDFVQTALSLDYYVNKWIRIKNARTHKCIQIGTLNNRLLQSTCGDGDEFLWEITKNQDNSYIVTSKKGNYVFDNNGSQNNNGNPQLAYALHAGGNQRWYINSYVGNSYRFTNQQSKKCLDLSAGNSGNGPFLQQWDCQDNNQNQAFDLEIPVVAGCHSLTPQLDAYTNKNFQIISTKTGKCLRFARNAKLTQDDCDTISDFAWSLQKNDDDTFFIKSFKGEYIIDNNDSKTNDGNPILSWRKHGGANQRWKIRLFKHGGNTYRLKNPASRKCIDVPAGGNGSGLHMQLWQCQDGNTNQEFHFKVIEPIYAKLLLQKYFAKALRIFNPRTKKCLKFDSPNTRLIQDDCRNTNDFGWNLIHNVNDNTYFIRSLLGNFVIDNSGSVVRDGNPILSWAQHGGDNQRWFLRLWDHSSFFIKGKQSRRCVDVPGGSSANNIGLQLWECQKKNQNQNFVFEEFSPVEELSLLSALTGKWIQVYNPKSGKCLRFVGANRRVQTYDCHNMGIVSWKLTYNSNDHTYFITSFEGNYVFDNEAARNNNGNAVLSYAFHGGNNQKWKIEPYDSKTFTIRGVQSGKCLDIDNGRKNNDIGLQQWDCLHNENQQFELRLVDPLYSHHLLSQLIGKQFKIANKASGRCLRLAVTNSKLYQGECNDADDVTWSIEHNSDHTWAIVSKKGNYVIDDHAGYSNNGNPIMIWGRHNGDNQRWYIVPYGGGYFRIIDKNSGKSIDIESGRRDLAPIVQLWDSITEDSNQAFTFVPLAETVRVRGFIKNAVDNNVLDANTLKSKGSSIQFNDGKKTYSATFNHGGVYEVILPKGSYTRTVNCGTFSKMSQIVNVQGPSDENTHSNTLFLSPIITGWRVVLTWAAEPRDLDSHLILPNREDIMYTNKESRDRSVNLDIDATAGHGPETITAKSTSAGLYRYYVHNYSAEIPITGSNAKVVVFHGGDLVSEFKVNPNAANPEHKYWHVFDIDGAANKLIPVDKMELAMK